VRPLDLVSEVAELSKGILKATNYGRAPFRPLDGSTAEMGEELFASVCLADDTGVDLGTTLDEAPDRCRQRPTLGGDAASGG